MTVYSGKCDFVCVCVYCKLPRRLLGQAGYPFLLFKASFYGQSRWQTSNCYTWHWYATRRLTRSRCTLNAVWDFYPTTSPIFPPHSQTLSGGVVRIFWTRPPSGCINARSRRDKGRDGLRDVFLGHVYTMWHLPPPLPSNTGGYGQLMVNYYITSPHPFSPFFILGF